MGLLVPHTVRYAVQGVHWPVGGQGWGQLVSEYGLACCGQAGSAGLWFSFVCPVVDKAGQEAGAGFLERRPSACLLVVELGVGPLVGRAMVRHGCGLRKSSGNLSADGWGYVPTQLVVWPEVSQHWSLQAVGARSWC